MNEDENSAAPKRMELDDEEKILCEFELAHTVSTKKSAPRFVF